MAFRRAKHAKRADGEDDEVGTADQAAPTEPSAGAMDTLLHALKVPAEPAPDSPSARAEQQSVTAAPGPRQPWLRRSRLAFRQWRRTRPFWAGVWCLLGGAIIIYGPLTVIKLVLVAGTVVWAGILIGALVCVMGLFMWFSPEFRQVLGVLAILFSMVSLVTSNFGGFVVGMLLGVIGGAMAFGWTPLPAKTDDAKVVAGGSPSPQPDVVTPGPVEGQAGPQQSADVAAGSRSPDATQNRNPPAEAHEDEPVANSRE